MRAIQSLGGRARAEKGARGTAGQFLKTQQGTQQETQPAGPRVPPHPPASSPKTPGLKGLAQLPLYTSWWSALADQYPAVDLNVELLRAMDWHRADRVKSPKLYFRHWVENAARWNPREEELTPDQIRERLRVVS